MLFFIILGAIALGAIAIYHIAAVIIDVGCLDPYAKRRPSSVLGEDDDQMLLDEDEEFVVGGPLQIREPAEGKRRKSRDVGNNNNYSNNNNNNKGGQPLNQHQYHQIVKDDDVSKSIEKVKREGYEATLSSANAVENFLRGMDRLNEDQMKTIIREMAKECNVSDAYAPALESIAIGYIQTLKTFLSTLSCQGLARVAIDSAAINAFFANLHMKICFPEVREVGQGLYELQLEGSKLRVIEERKGDSYKHRIVVDDQDKFKVD